MKKTLIFYIISVIIIIVGVVLMAVNAVTYAPDLAGGTEVEIAFVDDMTVNGYETVRAELKAELEKMGYTVDNGVMIKNVNIVKGVRFTLLGDHSGDDFSELTGATVSKVAPTETNPYKLIWVLAIALALQFLYGFFRFWKSNKLASALTVSVIYLHDVLLFAGIYAILSCLLGLQISGTVIAVAAVCAMLSSVSGYGSLASAKAETCPCKWVLPVLIGGVLGGIAMIVFGFTAVGAALIVAVAVVSYSALCLAVPTFKSFAGQR